MGESLGNFDIRYQAVTIRDMYGPHGIQQEGRLFEIGEETGIESGEHCQGKIGKNQSWKHAFECQNCGRRCAGRSGGANRFCRNECQQEFQVNRWFACSCCLAKIGLGQDTAAKILGIVTKTSVGRGWRSRGIVPEKPKFGSVVWAGRSIITAKRKEAEAIESEPQRLYDEAAMADIRSHRRFFDWSAVWVNERASRSSNAAYHLMTLEEKRARNNRCMTLRMERMALDPEIKRRHRERINQWKKDNPEKHLASVKKSIKKRKLVDPGFRVQCNLRDRLRDLMTTCRKGGSTQISELVGCTTRQLARHLESKFKRGMTWANYGTHWHVDHVLPCSSFNQMDARQRAQCWHWTNLEPLEAKKNMEKSDRITKPQMQLLLCATH